MNRLLEISLSSGLGLLLATPVFAVDVTTCGQVVPAYETGVLVADLDCSASGLPFSVTLRREATLDLNGHTLTGPPAGEHAQSAAAVRCDPAEETYMVTRCVTYSLESNKPCTVTSSTGTGTIVSSTGIVADRSLVANNLHITSANTGIHLGYRGRLRASELDFDGGGASRAIYALPLSLCADVWKGGNLSLENITSIGGGIFVAYQGKITARDIEIRDNTAGGISANRLKLTRATIRDNGSVGVVGTRVRLSQSEVTGNLYLGEPMDVATWDGPMPSLSDTTCGRSGKFNYLFDYVGTWGVCAGD